MNDDDLKTEEPKGLKFTVRDAGGDSKPLVTEKQEEKNDVKNTGSGSRRKG